MRYRIRIGRHDYYVSRASDASAVKVAHTKLRRISPGEKALVYREEVLIVQASRVGLFAGLRTG